MDPKMNRFIQVGIIVRDVNKAIAHFEELGFGPWRIDQFNSDVFPDFTINGEPAQIEMLCAFCTAYGMEFELIQPISEGPHMDWLKKHGPGIQHLSFTPADGFDDLFPRLLKISGEDAPWFRGQAKSAGMDFSYIDATEEMGVIFELHNEDKSKAPGHEF